MPGAPALDYCVDVRASVWVRIEGQHHYHNMELMQRHADGASILADVGELNLQQTAVSES